MKNPIHRVYIPLRLGVVKNSWTAITCIDAATNDYSIVTKYRFSAQKNLARQCYSVSKSVVALACGFLFDEGRLSPADPVAKFLGEYFPSDVDNKWYDVTLFDLFRHRTGAKDAVDFDNEQAPTGEVLTALFSSPITGETGKTWNYSDGNYYILARVFEKIAGMTAEDFLNENLFLPLGFYYNTWAKDDAGHLLGGTGLFLRTEDMAKLGVLVMNGGTYENKRYLSEKWIDLCTEGAKDNRYGFGIRNPSNNVFTITGMNGQGIFIDRKKKIVYAWHAQRRCPALGICFGLHSIGIV